MTIETNLSGVTTISMVINQTLFKRRYIGYSKEDCIKLFKIEVKKHRV